MAKQVQCDGCGCVVPAEEVFGNPPREWITVTRRDTEEPAKDFCSTDCVVSYLTEQRRAVRNRHDGVLDVGVLAAKD